MATHLPLGVAEDDGLSDGQRVIQIAQSVKLPLFSFHCHEKLLDAFQSQLVTGGQRQTLSLTLRTETGGRTRARQTPRPRAPVGWLRTGGPAHPAVPTPTVRTLNAATSTRASERSAPLVPRR